jgi:hypothetical protein
MRSQEGPMIDRPTHQLIHPKPGGRQSGPYRRRLVGRGPGNPVHKLAAKIVADMGGEANLSIVQLHLAKIAATLIYQIERLEEKLTAGEDIDIDQLSRLAGNAHRICIKLGIERKGIDNDPTLADWIADNSEEQPDAAVPSNPDSGRGST